jgi:hypothetical protein
VEVAWHSYELRPAGSPPIPAEYLARIKATEPRLLKMAREQYGLELNRGPLGISSRAAWSSSSSIRHAPSSSENSVCRWRWTNSDTVTPTRSSTAASS